MSEPLAEIYRDYIACLNRQDWDDLGLYVHEEAIHNGRPLGLGSYRTMLEQDFEAIPDLRFNIELLVSEPPYIASRLSSTVRRKGYCSASRSTANGSGSQRMFSMSSRIRS